MPRNVSATSGVFVGSARPAERAAAAIGLTRRAPNGADRRKDYANRLGFALQLTTVRFVGTFFDDPTAVPPTVLATMSRQPWHRYDHGLDRLSRRQVALRSCRTNPDGTWVSRPRGSRGRVWPHAMGSTHSAGRAPGTERPSALFDRATTWMLAHKVLLPGATTLERFVAKLRHPRRRARVARAGERHQSATAAPPRRSVARAR